MTTPPNAMTMAQARGFKNIHEWKKQNRKWFKKFVKGDERQRRIASRLDLEYMQHIRPNL